METPGQTAPSAPGGATETNYTPYILGFIIIVALVGIGYYAFGSRPNTIMPQTDPKKDPNNPMNQPIPGIDNKPGDKALGILTDQNFFQGLSNLANSLYGIAKDAKANKNQGNAGIQHDSQGNVVFDGPVTQAQATSGAKWGGFPYTM